MTLTTARRETQRPVDWMSSSQLRGTVAFVAGGGSGIGEATARVLSAAGASVVIADLRPEMAERVAREIAESGGQAQAVAMDVSVQADTEGALTQTITRFGWLVQRQGFERVRLITPAQLTRMSWASWPSTWPRSRASRRSRSSSVSPATASSNRRTRSATRSRRCTDRHPSYGGVVLTVRHSDLAVLP